MLVYKLFYKIAKFAVRELAQNPELQAKTATLVKEQIEPEAKARWRKAKPRFEHARITMTLAASEVADGAQVSNPKGYTNMFFSKVSKRLRDRVKH